MWHPDPVRAEIKELRRHAGVTIRRGADRRHLDSLERWIGARLPKLHRDLLGESNGLETCWGYRRILGVGEATENLAPWNEAECWKFAWQQPLSNFLCFAETGIGDQFAYRLDGLRQGDDQVFMLDAYLMNPDPRPVAESFATFLKSTVAGAAEMSPRFVEAHRQVGSLGLHEHAILSPSPLLVGLDEAKRFAKMSARLAMTVNGDLASQLLDPAREGQTIDRIDQELDEKGWPRLRIVWATPTG